MVLFQPTLELLASIDICLTSKFLQKSFPAFQTFNAGFAALMRLGVGLERNWMEWEVHKDKRAHGGL